jgi:ClpP class serine protease
MNNKKNINVPTMKIKKSKKILKNVEKKSEKFPQNIKKRFKKNMGKMVKKVDKYRKISEYYNR